MNCRRVDDFLSDHLEGLLPPRLARAVDAHLDGCPACRHRQAQLRAIGPDLQDLAELRTTPGLFHRAVERWTEQATGREGVRDAGHAPASGAVRGPWNGWGRSLALTAAGVAAVVGIVALLRGPVPATRPAGTEIAASPPPSTGGEIRRPATAVPAPEAGARRASAPPRPPRGSTRERPRPRPATPLRLTGVPGRGSRPPAIEGVSPRPAGRLPKGIARDDLVVLNENRVQEARLRAPRPPEAWTAIVERARQRVRGADDFVQIPFPRLASTSERQIAQAVERYQREVAIVDARLARDVTVQRKATALSDLCEQLRADTGIRLDAGSSVADEKVTIFCRKLPLRDVMRQLSRPFGYTWLRSEKAGEYRYELVQDLRSQLLEEELRDRGRNAALLALDRELERFRPYLGLSPEEVRTRATTAAPEEKKLLERLTGHGWGAIQLYFRLTPRDLAAMRAGRRLAFSAVPEPDEQPLPPDLAQLVLRSLSDGSMRIRDGGFVPPEEKDSPDGLLPASVPEARAIVKLWLDRSELGQTSLAGGSGVRLTPRGGTMTTGTLAVGRSPSVRDPATGATQAGLARDPALRLPVTVRPRSSCQGDLSPNPSPLRGGVPASEYGIPRPEGAQRHDSAGAGDKLPLSVSGRGPGGGVKSLRGPGGEINPQKVTSADVLEALYRTCGLPIVADSYTRLYPLSAGSMQNMPLFEALNRLADTMRLWWSKDGKWLQFRSASYYDDRLKEVPNRLLSRWVASRRQHGAMTLEDLIEIMQLSDAQLDSEIVQEAARDCLGLIEWDLVHYPDQRPHLRYLASLTPAQRQMALRPTGLPFSRMSLAQQQQFVALGPGSRGERLPSLADLREATLRVDYTQRGVFEWSRVRGSDKALIPQVALPGRDGSAPSPVRERTPEAALLAARRIDPQVDATQIMPTELALSVFYRWGDSHAGYSTSGITATPNYTRNFTLDAPRDRGGDSSPDVP